MNPKDKERYGYDKVPVYYCKKCTSLLILKDKICGDYCAECGSTDIDTTTIKRWLKLKEDYTRHA